MRNNFPRSSLLLASTFATLLAASSAHATPPASYDDAVAQLSGFEHVPSDAEFRSWGAQGAVFLMRMGDDAQVQVRFRARAVYALRLFSQNAEVHAWLQRFARDTSTVLPTLHRGALDALILGFDDVSTVSAHLRDARVEIRDGAAWALSRSRNPAAREAVRNALRTESDPTVRATLQRASQ